MVRHLYQKSISEVLIRILNVSETIFEDHLMGAINSIRQSFVHKIVKRMGPDYDVEDHINAASLLGELVEYKLVYTELVNQRNLQIFRDYLQSDNSSSKANIYLLLVSIV